jgi:membrane-associated phospholipid phosphatase
MDFTRLLARSYTMTGLSTLLIKGITNTDRPSDTWNNGHFGFPSAHAATSFAIAATIEEYYGPEAGLPAYLMAGLIGWSRIDDRDHDLSDVVFGAVLGYAIAKSIAGQELRGDSRIRMCPWMEPGNRTVGALCEIEF